MPFGINLRVSGDAAAYWELVGRASALEAEPTIQVLRSPPHITLAKYDDALPGELEAIVDALADVSAVCTATRLSCGGDLTLRPVSAGRAAAHAA